MMDVIVHLVVPCYSDLNSVLVCSVSCVSVVAVNMI